MSKEQTALERIKDEVAKEKGYDNWRHMEINWPTVVTDNIWPEVCERFASECCQATLEKAAGKATGSVKEGLRGIWVDVNKQSITNKDNICIL